MESLYQPETLSQITERINRLKPDTERKWGKMTVSQMLAHCSFPLRLAVGDEKRSISLIGRLFGSFVKKKLMSEQPFGKNLPTDKSFIVTETRSFEEEKQTVMELLNRFHKNGAAGIPKDPHPFFGKMDSRQWDNLMYKHIDHHLRQFGV